MGTDEHGFNQSDCSRHCMVRVRVSSCPSVVKIAQLPFAASIALAKDSGVGFS